MNRIHFYIPIVLQSLIYLVTRTLFTVFCRLQIRGLEHLRGMSGPIIFAANHSSEWDGPLIRSCLPFFSSRFSPMYYVAMPREFYKDCGWRKVLYGGILFNLLGAYPIYSGRKDYGYSLQNHIQILKLGRNVCIFPEGRRTRDGTLGEARGGVAYLSFATGAPIVPVTVSGLALFSVRDLFLASRRVSVTFGKPIYLTELLRNSHPTSVEYKETARHILNEIRIMLGQAIPSGLAMSMERARKPWYTKQNVKPRGAPKDPRH